MLSGPASQHGRLQQLEPSVLVGLAAVNQIANQIALGQIDIGIGAGVESMTLNYGAGVMPAKMSDAVMENEEAADCLMPMGITSENVAKKYNIDRTKQDTFAADSFAKAAAAQKAGKFKSEIVTVKYTDDDGNERTIDSDDGIREGVTVESLSKLKPALPRTASPTPVTLRRSATVPLRCCSPAAALPRSTVFPSLASLSPAPSWVFLQHHGCRSRLRNPPPLRAHRSTRRTSTSLRSTRPSLRRRSSRSSTLASTRRRSTLPVVPSPWATPSVPLVRDRSHGSRRGHAPGRQEAHRHLDVRRYRYGRC